MKTVLVTGSTGFLGSYTIPAILARGHRVRALVRPASRVPEAWTDRDDIEVVRGDLRAKPVDPALLDGVDVVAHLAASKAGDIHAQLSGTVVATENLLEAMAAAGSRQIVLISTFSVYDYRAVRSWSRLDESSPLEGRPEDRDEYCRTKLLQERLVHEAGERNGWDVVVLRPGVIYGRDNLWTARLGVQIGSRWIRTGGLAPLPLTYVENCADAIALACERADIGGIHNVVDDETPSQRAFARMLQARVTPRPTIIPVPWPVMRLIATGASLFNRLILGNRAKVPGLFVPARLLARGRPLRYRSDSLRTSFGWSPRFSVAEALDRACSDTSMPECSAATSAAPIRADESKGVNA